MMSQASTPPQTNPPAPQSDSTLVWGIVKGIGLVVEGVLAGVDPPAAAALVAALAIGDAIVAILQQLNGAVPQSANLQGSLDQQAKAVLLMAGPNFQATAPAPSAGASAAPMSAAPVNIAGVA